MRPVLRDGESYSLTLVPPRVGDIVVFRDGEGRLVAHRLLGCYWKGSTRYLTRGDAARTVDPAFERGALLGVLQVPVHLHERLHAHAAFVRELGRRSFAKLSRVLHASHRKTA